MSLLKKLAVATALTAVMLSAPAALAQTKIALVVKSLGNGFFDAANKGAQEAAKELGDVEVIYTGPTTATAEGQIEIINSLIAQNVNAIAISANDPDALVPALKKAMERGITQQDRAMLEKPGVGLTRVDAANETTETNKSQSVA